MLLDDIATYLQAQGIGTMGVDIFLGLIPDQPDNCIALFEYAGSPPNIIGDTDEEKPGLQARVRNTSYPAGRSKIEQVVTALHTITNTTLGDTYYLSIFANQSPQSLGRDANNRAEFVVNFSVLKIRG